MMLHPVTPHPGARMQTVKNGYWLQLL